MISGEVSSNNDLGWAQAFSELIDNAFDAQASTVTLEVLKTERKVRVVDNGRGAPDPVSMFRIGVTSRNGSDGALGRYGVGLKSASQYLTQLSGWTEITTGNASVFASARLRWGDLLHSDKWETDRPRVVDAADALQLLQSAHGTSIEFELDQNRGFPSSTGKDSKSNQWLGIKETLQQNFAPALRDGKQIRLLYKQRKGEHPKVEVLKPPSDPLWRDAIEVEIRIKNKTATLRAGLIDRQEDRKQHRGLSYSYGHRVILKNTAAGCGVYNTEGFCGRVELDHNWRLAKHKDGISDHDWQLLQDAILQHVQPLLEKQSQTIWQIQMEARRNEINELVGEFFEGLGQAKRPNKKGTERNEAERDIERTVRQATVVDGEGKVKGRKRSANGFLIQFEDGESPEEVCRVDQNGKTVYLNRINPGVSELMKEQQNKALANKFLAGIAIGYFAMEQSFGLLPTGKRMKYQEMMGAFMSNQYVKHETIDCSVAVN